MLEWLRRVDVSNGVFDEVISGPSFVRRFPVLAPKIVLVIAVGGLSCTGRNCSALTETLPKPPRSGFWRKELVCWSATWLAGQPCIDTVYRPGMRWIQNK